MVDRKQFLSDVGKRVRQARERKNMSFFDLAAVSGISKRQLVDLEHGKVNTSMINMKILSIVLEVSLDDLMK